MIMLLKTDLLNYSKIASATRC